MPSRTPTSSTLNSPTWKGDGVGTRRMWRTHWTALTSNGRPMPVLNPAAFNSATSSWLVNVGPRWTMNSVALLGVRVVTYWGGGRRVTICSLAPERHRMPIRDFVAGHLRRQGDVGHQRAHQ